MGVWPSDTRYLARLTRTISSYVHQADSNSKLESFSYRNSNFKEHPRIFAARDKEPSVTHRFPGQEAGQVANDLCQAVWPSPPW